MVDRGVRDGDDGPWHVHFEVVPWPVLRDAMGMVAGVCELLGAAPQAQRALELVADARAAEEFEREAAILDDARRSAVEAQHELTQALMAHDENVEDFALAASCLLGKPSRLLAGYRSADRLLELAIAHGLTGSRRSMRLLRRALRALRATNLRHGIGS